jgi:ABC-type thiamine transport system ATPase subunit
MWLAAYPADVAMWLKLGRCDVVKESPGIAVQQARRSTRLTSALAAIGVLTITATVAALLLADETARQRLARTVRRREPILLSQ